MRRLVFVAGFLALSFPPWADGLRLASPLTAGEVQGPNSTDELITRGVLEMIQQKHLLKREIDNEMAGAALDQFLQGLDPDKQFFLRSDVDSFNRGKRDLAEKLKKGDVALPFEVYRRYQQRVEECAKVWRELLTPDARFDFTTDEAIILNAQALDYPKNAAERAERWRQSMKYSLLVMKTDPDAQDFDLARACKTVLGRYERFARGIDRTKSDAVLEQFLSCVGRRYDDGTRYISPSSVEEYQTQMRGNYAGIGAVLLDEDGVVIQSVYPDSPAEKDGHLKAKDRIVSVGQDADGELVDVTGMTQKEAVALIRGPSGSLVRLGVIRAGETKPQTVSIRRAAVVLPEAKVEAQVFEQGTKADGKPYKVGYISLPNFYVDDASGNSSTKDVRKRLEGFASRGVDVVVLDIRHCGGGYISEAVSLSGLFVDQGTILQYKDNTGSVQKYDNSDTKMAWTKGLVVLTSRQTGSGAEILCAAVQDRNRGLLVGDESTFGAGTVHTLITVADQVLKIANPPNLGTLQVTTSQFYRVNGDSVQKRGVLTDISLPSLTDAAVQDSTATSAIGFDRVAPTAFRSHSMVSAEAVERLRRKSQARRDASADFAQVQKRLEWGQSQRKQLLVTLNEKKYREQQKENGAPAVPEVKPGEADYCVKEAVAIAGDYAGLLGGKTATPADVAAAPVTTTTLKPLETPPAPVVPDKAAQRRAVEIQILDAERAVELSSDEVQRYTKEASDWGTAVQNGNEALKQADTAGKQFVVGAAIGFSLGQQVKAEQNRSRAKAALDANRDRLLQLRQERIRLQD